jgi:site-specific DNA-methyltransferase (adenine-specific)
VKPYYADDLVTLYHGDCRDVMPDLVGVGLVVTDPPYVFGLASTAQEGKAGGWGDMMNSATFYASVLRDVRRLFAGRTGAAWVCNSWRSFPVLARAAFEARWPIESLLVWDKVGIGPGGPRGLRPTYELAALFIEGDFRIVDRGTPDIWQQRPGSKVTSHAAEKPVALMARMIRAGNDSGSVFDPFAGSGTTLVAAKSVGRTSIGCEIEERNCELAAERCRQDVLDLGGAA